MQTWCLEAQVAAMALPEGLGDLPQQLLCRPRD